MNMYSKVCTHQQTRDSRKNFVAIVSNMPAKECTFRMAFESAKKTHIINMARKGFLDSWYYRINFAEKILELIPARDLHAMMDRQNWSKI